MGTLGRVLVAIKGTVGCGMVLAKMEDVALDGLDRA